MMTSRYPAVAAALIVAVCSFGAVASVDTIIPQPKQLKQLGWRADLSNAKILIAGKDKKLKVAAEEINDKLGPAALEVSEGASVPEAGSAVVILSADSPEGGKLVKEFGLGITRDKPGKQGYGIRFVKRPNGALVFLAGSDSQGALYAAVTFRHLLGVEGDKPFALACDITDWPDFKLRQIGVPFAIPLRSGWYELRTAESKGDKDEMKKAADAYFEQQKRYIDWLLRHKSNFMDPQPAAWAAPRERLTDFLKKAIRRVNEYALDRGIGTFYYESCCIGRYPQDKDNPDFKDVLFYKGHKRYFCWSRLDYHRKKARAIAETLRDCRYTGFFLHDVDGGGWQDPAMWSKRCERCRKMYGDDHVKADVTMFGIYHEEIKKLAPDVRFVAVVYPYSPSYLNADLMEKRIRDEMGEIPNLRKTAEEVAARHRRFLTEIGRRFPKDIYICVRENTRENIDLIRACYGKRPFQLYYEYAYWKGWRPQFIMTPRWSKTFFYEGIEDILYGNNTLYNYNPIMQMYGLECAWNTDGPGRGLFPGREAWMDPRQCIEPRDVAEKFVLKACRDFWGDTAGPYMVPVFMGNLSYYFITDPDPIVQKCSLTNAAELMGGQYGAAKRAAESLAKLWDISRKARASGKPLMNDYAFPFYVDFYKLVSAAKVMAGYKYRKMLAREAVIGGDADGADKLLAQIARQLDEDEKTLARLRAELEDAPTFAGCYRGRSPFGILFRLDVNELRRDFEKFKAGRQELFESHNIPRWFKGRLTGRRLIAVPANGKIAIDGKLDEASWATAPPAEHFLNYKVLRLASLETTCRILYDADNIYFGFECFDERTGEINIPRRERDDHEVCDSVEVFLDPGRTRKCFYQWIIDTGGTLFDAAKLADAKGVLKYSRDFDSRCRYAVARRDDRWTCEIAIPFSDLGGAPKAGRTWGGNVCRNIVHVHDPGEEESVTFGFLDGGNFHTVEKFPALEFAPKAPALPKPAVDLQVRNRKFAHVTTGEGAGATVTCDMTLQTNVTLHDVSLAGEMWVGDKQVGRVSLFERPRVELVWRSLRPVRIDVDTLEGGVEIIFVVKAREGEWRFRQVFGSPPRRKVEPARFVPGVEGRALKSPVYFAACRERDGEKVWNISQQSGTIEFWIKPEWDGLSAPHSYLGMKHALFDMGPVRFDYPYLTNCRSIAIWDSGHGSLIFQVTNRNYKHRTASADIKAWRAGEWHHVACQWNINRAGECVMDIFLDGKRVGVQSKPREDAPFRKEEELFAVQVGAMNTGACAMEAAIDNLRISSGPRYESDFSPGKSVECDAKTTVLFRFDGDLKGETPAGDAVTAGPGTVG